MPWNMAIYLYRQFQLPFLDFGPFWRFKILKHLTYPFGPEKSINPLLLKNGKSYKISNKFHIFILEKSPDFISNLIFWKLSWKGFYNIKSTKTFRKCRKLQILNLGNKSLLAGCHSPSLVFVNNCSSDCPTGTSHTPNFGKANVKIILSTKIYFFIFRNKKIGSKNFWTWRKYCTEAL